MAAPTAPYGEINKRFNIKFNTAPPTVLHITMLSFPNGYKICKPITLLNPMNKITGAVQQSTGTASGKSSQQKIRITGIASTINPTMQGKDTPTTNR